MNYSLAYVIAMSFIGQSAPLPEPVRAYATEAECLAAKEKIAPDYAGVVEFTCLTPPNGGWSPFTARSWRVLNEVPAREARRQASGLLAR